MNITFSRLNAYKIKHLNRMGSARGSQMCGRFGKVKGLGTSGADYQTNEIPDAVAWGRILKMAVYKEASFQLLIQIDFLVRKRTHFHENAMHGSQRRIICFLLNNYHY